MTYFACSHNIFVYDEHITKVLARAHTQVSAFLLQLMSCEALLTLRIALIDILKKSGILPNPWKGSVDYRKNFKCVETSKKAIMRIYETFLNSEEPRKRFRTNF